MLIEPAAAARFGATRPMPQLLYDSSDVRLVVFAFRAGQALEPHTSTSTVVMQVLEGQGRISVGIEERAAGPGQVFVCPPNVPHAIAAETDMKMLAVIAPRM